MNRRERAAALLETLPGVYPHAHVELDYSTPLELMVASLLAAQCTDKRINVVTVTLFARCRTAADYASIGQEELEEIIHSAGFFRAKARNLRALGAALVERHGGEVPREMDALCALPGIGRKTANVVLGNAYGLNQGIVVDTHVGRLALRLGLSKHSDPGKVESDLMKLAPRERWTDFANWLVLHGRRRCHARSPDCPHCEVHTICPVGRKLLARGKA